MDYSKIVETKVGIFVVVAVFLGLGFIMMVGGDKSFFRSSETLHLKVDETLGLAVGGVVQIAGVPCGNVDKIDFLPETNKLDISLKIDKKFSARITRGSTAGIRTQGALGDKFVSIKPGPFEAEPLKDQDTIYAEEGSDFLSALGKSGSRVEKVFDILDHIEQLARSLNEGQFAKNLAESMRHFKHSTESLDEIVDSLKSNDGHNNRVRRAVDHLSSILEKIDNGQGTVGGLINDPTVHEDLKTLLGGAKRSKLLKYLIRQTIQKGEEEEGKSSSAK